MGKPNKGIIIFDKVGACVCVFSTVHNWRDYKLIDIAHQNTQSHKKHTRIFSCIT